MIDSIVAPFVLLGMTPFGVMLVVAEMLGAGAVWRCALRRRHLWIGGRQLAGAGAVAAACLVTVLVARPVGPPVSSAPSLLG